MFQQVGNVTQHGKESSYSFCLLKTQEYSFPLISHFSSDMWHTVVCFPTFDRNASAGIILPSSQLSARDNDEKWQLTPGLGVGERVGSGGTLANLCIKLLVLGNESPMLVECPTI